MPPLESKSQRVFNSKVIRKVGICLFVISFLAPYWKGGEDFRLFGGCMAFVQAPIFAFEFIRETGAGAPSHPIFLFVVIIASWLANFTIFKTMYRIPPLISILLPWPAYLMFFSVLGGFIPFYPWAGGIALIHLSRISRLWPNETLQPTAAALGISIAGGILLSLASATSISGGCG